MMKEEKVKHVRVFGVLGEDNRMVMLDCDGDIIYDHLLEEHGGNLTQSEIESVILVSSGKHYQIQGDKLIEISDEHMRVLS